MELYELIGFIIGDGNIYYNEKYRAYRLELCGNVEEDYDYFKQINKFLEETTNRKPILFTRKEVKGKSIRIQFNNKEFIDKLVEIGLPKGKKTFNIKIPDKLLKDEIMLLILKGLFEADGCLYFSKSKKIEYPSYPRLEIRTSSPLLVEQIKNFLKEQGFKIYIKHPVSDRTFSIVLSGENMLQKWIDKIGFSSEKNTTKYKIWKTKGFYIPNTQLKDRLIMCGDGTAATAVDF